MDRLERAGIPLVRLARKNFERLQFAGQGGDVLVVQPAVAHGTDRVLGGFLRGGDDGVPLIGERALDVVEPWRQTRLCVRFAGGSGQVLGQARDLSFKTGDKLRIRIRGAAAGAIELFGDFLEAAFQRQHRPCVGLGAATRIDMLREIRKLAVERLQERGIEIGRAAERRIETVGHAFQPAVELLQKPRVDAFPMPRVDPLRQVRELFVQRLQERHVDAEFRLPALVQPFRQTIDPVFHFAEHCLAKRGGTVVTFLEQRRDLGKAPFQAVDDLLALDPAGVGFQPFRDLGDLTVKQFDGFIGTRGEMGDVLDASREIVQSFGHIGSRGFFDQHVELLGQG